MESEDMRSALRPTIEAINALTPAFAAFQREVVSVAESLRVLGKTLDRSLAQAYLVDTGRRLPRSRNRRTMKLRLRRLNEWFEAAIEARA